MTSTETNVKKQCMRFTNRISVCIQHCLSACEVENEKYILILCISDSLWWTIFICTDLDHRNVGS